jgi:AcrR family transcriptional regulator
MIGLSLAFEDRQYFMSSRREKGLKADRPRRGTPAQTRARLVTTAAEIFNRVGYYGTDSNRIAKEAGYATGTFYKHFKDKREAFLAVYETWVTSEWAAIDLELSTGSKAKETARRLVELSIDFHRKWRGLRASLMELVFTDEEVRRFYRSQRRRQLDVIAQLRLRHGIPAGRREDDAIHLFTTERTYDAIGQGELQALGLDHNIVVEAMVEKVFALLS